jgi:putative membrane protein
MIKFEVINKKWAAYSYGIFLIMALAAAYELFEWQYAVSVNPEAGIEVLGSQGDVWDAQKDMLMDTLGAILGAIIYFVCSYKSKVNFK